MRKETADFLGRAGLSFQADQLIERALTHSSWTFEHNLDKDLCNERLEFLGDAVLEVCISLLLYRARPAMAEGRMSKIRSLLTREETLALIARDLKLGDALLLGKGEEASGGRDKASTLSDALEAVIAALYLDQGFAAVSAWLLPLMEPYYGEALAGRLRYDFKSAFQELVQSFTPIPSIHYELTDSRGPEHHRFFTVTLYLDGEALSQGQGRSKKEAEQAASHQGLLLLQERSEA